MNITRGCRAIAPQEVLDNLAKSVTDLIDKEQVGGLAVGLRLLILH